MVKDTAYYDLIGVAPDADKNEIGVVPTASGKGALVPPRQISPRTAPSRVQGALGGGTRRSSTTRRARTTTGTASRRAAPPNFADARDVFAATFGGRALSRGSHVAMAREVDEGLQNAAATFAAAAMAKRQEIEAARAEQRPADEVGQRVSSRRSTRRRGGGGGAAEAHKAAQALRVQQLAALLKARVEGYVAAPSRSPPRSSPACATPPRARARLRSWRRAAANRCSRRSATSTCARRRRMAKMSGGLRGASASSRRAPSSCTTCRRASAPSAASSGWRVRRSSCQGRAAAEGAAGSCPRSRRWRSPRRSPSRSSTLLWKVDAARRRGDAPRGRSITLSVRS